MSGGGCSPGPAGSARPSRGAAWRRLRGARRGSVYIELAAAILLLVAVVVGTAEIGARIIDTTRDSRALRAGLDLAWQLDEEAAGAPAQAAVEEIRRAAAVAAGIDTAAPSRIIITLFGTDSTGNVVMDWQAAAATGDLAQASGARIADGMATLGAHRFSLRAGENLVAVEFFRGGHGLADTGGIIESRGVVLKPD